MSLEYKVTTYTLKELDAAFKAVAQLWRSRGYHEERILLGRSIFGRSIAYCFYEIGTQITCWKLTPTWGGVKCEGIPRNASPYDLSDWDQFAWRKTQAIWQDVVTQLRIWHRPPPQPPPPEAAQPASSPEGVGATRVAGPQPQRAAGDGTVLKMTEQDGGMRKKKVLQTSLPNAPKGKPTPSLPPRLILNETQRQGLLIYAQAIDAGEPTGKAIRDWGLMEESHVTELVRKTIQSGQLQELLQGWHSEHLLRDPKIVMALILQRRRSGKPKA